MCLLKMSGFYSILLSTWNLNGLKQQHNTTLISIVFILISLQNWWLGVAQYLRPLSHCHTAESLLLWGAGKTNLVEITNLILGCNKDILSPYHVASVKIIRIIRMIVHLLCYQPNKCSSMVISWSIVCHQTKWEQSK